MEATYRQRCLTLLALCAACVALLFFQGCENYGEGAGDFHTVIMDAGHGGHDQGAKARSGAWEKTLTLDTASRVATILRANGFRVIETRTTDTFIPLDARSQASNQVPGSIFVSIHYNWAPRGGPHGIEIYYYTPRSRRLAANVLAKVITAYPTINRGVKRNNYHVLRTNRRPAILCELGFVSSPQDNSYLQNPEYRQRLAERVAAGIMAEKKGLSP